MLKCKKAERLISLYLDGEIKNNMAEKLKNHLTSCNSCRSWYEFFKGGMAADIPQDQINPSSDFNIRFWDKVEAECPLPEEKERKAVRAGRLVFVPLYAAAALTLFILSFSASVVFAYRLNVIDRSADKEIVKYYLEENVFSVNLTMLSCLRFLSRGKECIERVCIKGECRQPGKCELCLTGKQAVSGR